MANCEECLHIDVCECDKVYGGTNSELCPTFKDRSRIVELPCNLGDTVYVKNDTLPTHRLDMTADEIPPFFPAIIVSIRKNTHGVWIKFRIHARWLQQQYDVECGPYEDGVDMWKYFTFPASAIGKTVLLTREEAERTRKRR